jgi:2-polyprenyl-3-methyl-5-hydroxy-6-metoxy-1,4-benzoquinol methylase
LEQLAYHIENRESWKNEYGTLLRHLPSITETLYFIQEFKKLDSEPLRILDYGCAFGYYLAVLKAINPLHDLYGVECAKEGVEATATVIGPSHVFWQRSGTHVPIDDSSVDVITCFDVIEHIKDKNEVVAFLKECSRIVKPNGYIFIRTPNCNLPMKLLFSVTGRSWIYNGKEHPSPFTARQLVKLTAPILKTVKTSYAAGVLPKYRLLHSVRVSPHFMLVLKKLP